MGSRPDIAIDLPGLITSLRTLLISINVSRASLSASKTPFDTSLEVENVSHALDSIVESLRWLIKLHSLEWEMGEHTYQIQERIQERIKAIESLPQRCEESSSQLRTLTASLHRAAKPRWKLQALEASRKKSILERECEHERKFWFTTLLANYTIYLYQTLQVILS